MVVAQNAMLLATIIWLPWRLPPVTYAHPRPSAILYAGGSFAAWTLLCFGWLELNYAMSIDIPAIGPPVFCMMMWVTGTLVYGVRLKVVRARLRKMKTQNQAS